jgi:hypothetical protein
MFVSHLSLSKFVSHYFYFNFISTIYFFFLNLFLSDETIFKLIVESNLCRDPKDFKKLNEFKEKLKPIIEKKDSLIKIFDLDGEDSSQNIELSILRAFLNSISKINKFSIKFIIIFNYLFKKKILSFKQKKMFTKKIQKKQFKN